MWYLLGKRIIKLVPNTENMDVTVYYRAVNNANRLTGKTSILKDLQEGRVHPSGCQVPNSHTQHLTQVSSLFLGTATSSWIQSLASSYIPLLLCMYLFTISKISVREHELGGVHLPYFLHYLTFSSHTQAVIIRKTLYLSIIFETLQGAN